MGMRLKKSQAQDLAKCLFGNFAERECSLNIYRSDGRRLTLHRREPQENTNGEETKVGTRMFPVSICHTSEI
jgi:hypothetical protein